MYRELHDLLTDPDHDRGARLLRLQGWRGDQLCRATDAGLVARLAPAFCALGGLTVALVGSSALAAAVAVTAAVGVVAANHPVEWVANALAARVGRVPLPRNRAAKRLGCAIGTVLLVVAAIAFASGHTVAGAASAGVLAAVAGFVAVTNLCVPSAIFTVLWGAERAQAPSLAVLLPGGRRH